MDTLRDYQQEIVSRIHEAWKHHRSVMAQMPGVDLWLALGATIDFEAGNIQRAPKIYQKLAMEWLYRLQKEPKRMYQRYFKEDLVFFWHFLKQLLGTYINPFA